MGVGWKGRNNFGRNNLNSKFYYLGPWLKIFPFFSKNSKKSQNSTTSDPGWKNFPFFIKNSKNRKIPLPRTLVEIIFRFSVKISKNPKIPLHRTLKFQNSLFLSDRTATLITGDYIPASKLLIPRKAELYKSWPCFSIS